MAIYRYLPYKRRVQACGTDPSGFDTTSLVAWWDLADDENDDSGAGLNLTYNAGTGPGLTFGTDMDGNANDAYDQEVDNSEYMNLADQAAIDITGDISMVCWVNVEAGQTAGIGHLISKWRNAQNQRAYQWAFDNSANQVLFAVSSDGKGTTTETATMTQTLSRAEWYHLAVTFDASASDVTMYLNGFSSAHTETATFPTSINNSTSDLGVGSTNAGTEPIDGLICRASLWSRVLSASEVETLWDCGTDLRYAGLA